MGKWMCYHLTLGPGERDPEAVAAELRGVLPDVLAEHVDADVERILGEAPPDVWEDDDGVVHWTTGENHGIAPLNWEGLVPALGVPARWACATWQLEVEYCGAGWVYGWVDGESVRVDDLAMTEGSLGADALAVAARDWGVAPAVKRGRHPDVVDASATPDPSGTPGFEPVRDADAVDPHTELERALDADATAAARREAAERAYVRVRDAQDRAGLDPLEPAVYEALDDPATRWAAGALVRELAPGRDALNEALASDDARRRGAALRHCVYAPSEQTPYDALCRALGDVDAGAEHRALATRALDRAGVGRTASPYDDDLDHPPQPRVVDDLLAAATGDSDPRVRAPAVTAAVRYASLHAIGDATAATDALVDALTDDAPEVREAVRTLLAVRAREVVAFLPDDVTARFVRRVAELDATGDLPDLEPVYEAGPYANYRPGMDAAGPRMLVEYASTYWLDEVDPVLEDLVVLGWKEDGDLARAAVGKFAEERPGAVRDAAEAVGLDPETVP